MDLAATIFGKKLTALREEKGFDSIRSFAKQIPLSHTSIENYEDGKYLPPTSTLRPMARALGMRFEQLHKILLDSQMEALMRASGMSPKAVEQAMSYLNWVSEQEKREGEG